MKLHPLIERLAAALDDTWQRTLTLSDYPFPADLGYIEGKLEGERIAIHNRCYQSPEFRKLHIELAQVGSGLDILHCVMFPRDTYPLPLFGADLVGGRGQIGAAIVDLSPTVPLSEAFRDRLQSWHDLRQSFTQPRELPAWGSIFSEYCTFVRLQGAEEEERFLELATHYVTLNCEVAQNLHAAGAEATGAEREAIAAAQRRYCAQQRQNDKTRRILEKAFGEAWAERYMRTVLFDVEES